LEVLESVRYFCHKRFYAVWNNQADQVNRLDGQLNGLCRQGRGGDNIWTRTSPGVSGKETHARAESTQGVSVPVRARPGAGGFSLPVILEVKTGSKSLATESQAVRILRGQTNQNRGGFVLGTNWPDRLVQAVRQSTWQPPPGGVNRTKVLK